MAVGFPSWLKLSAGLLLCAGAAWLLAGEEELAVEEGARGSPPVSARDATSMDWSHPDCPDGMSLIPGGELGRPGLDAPLQPFCLARHEVTVAEYRACVASGKCTTPSSKRRCNWDREETDEHPINCVTWAQADTYCSAHGGRLPTEWEWEWAALGGSRDRTYPWGERKPGPFHANLCFNECRSQMVELELDGTTELTDGWVLTSPVGMYDKGDGHWGLQDMIGNVGEWTSTGLPQQEGHFVFRGASWYHHQVDHLSHKRFHAPGDVPDSAVGVRCAAFPGESEQAG